MFTLPVTNLPAYSFDISLDNNSYKFFFTWNSSYEFYTMDITTITDVTLIRGVKLVLGVELIRRYAIEALPAGALLTIDTTGKHDRITRDSLGTSVQLVYVAKEELDAIIQQTN